MSLYTKTNKSENIFSSSRNLFFQIPFVPSRHNSAQIRGSPSDPSLERGRSDRARLCQHPSGGAPRLWLQLRRSGEPVRNQSTVHSERVPMCLFGHQCQTIVSQSGRQLCIMQADVILYVIELPRPIMLIWDRPHVMNLFYYIST